jgi:hypothetical protein
MTCRFVSTTEPRVISGRHLTPCACDDRELGCLPCPDTHCVVCGKEHAKAACTGCLDDARSDLKAIGGLCASLPAEAVEKGVQSEAMMLLGPSSDPEAWRNRATSAMVGRLDASYLEDCRDELHPLWVLGTWEQVWRDHLTHYSIGTITVASAHAYLDMQIGYMAEQVDPAFDEFARELRGCRAHLENVLHDGIREQRGAPCLQCERPLILVYGANDQLDHWECTTCRRVLSEGDYRRAVYAAHVAIADRLTAADLSERTGIKASVIRVWGSRDQTIKRGRNHLGITLYDVASVIAKSGNLETEQAG